MRIVRLLFVFCVGCGLARAQTQPVTQTINATGQCASIRASNNSTVGIIVSGTWSGTLTPNLQISAATGAPTASTTVTPSNSTTPQATITANGGYKSAIGGFSQFNLCSTGTWTSGTATVELYSSPGVNAGLLGNGGSGGSWTAGGDLSGDSSSQTVIGVDGVPLCTGFTPTNGEALMYSTALSPNPCYTAANGSYTLPTATSSVLGGVKPDGTSILNTAGAISATAASVGAAAAPINAANEAASFPAACGGWYTITANSVTATLPTSPNVGCSIGIAAVAGVTGTIIDPNSNTFYVTSQVAAIANLPLAGADMVGIGWDGAAYHSSAPIVAGSGVSITPGATGNTISNTFSTGSSQCQVFSTADSFCLTLPPYYASPEGATTTTSTFAVGTSGTVGSCSTFTANEGIWIAGAGTSGANYLGSIVSCVGTALTVTPTTATSVTAPATTTSGTFGVGTHGSVAACTNFVAGEFVTIAGAGVAGATYVGNVISCSSTTLTVAPATSTSISSGAAVIGQNVQHDETAAFLAAFTTLNPGGGTIYLPGSATGSQGLYLVNGPLLDTGGANAVLPMPKLPNYVGTITVIAIKGFILPYAAPTIQTSLATAGNLFGGYDSVTGGGFPGFTNVILDMENVQIVGPSNPNMVAVNGTYLLGLEMRHVTVSTPDGTPASTTPTHSGSAGVLYPKVSNNLYLEGDDLAAWGYYTDVRLGEHAQINSLYLANSHNALVLDAGGGLSGQNYTNAISVNYVWCGPYASVVNCAVGGASPTTMNVMVMDVEGITGYAVSDPSNFLQGTLGLNMPGWNCASPTFASMISGGAKLQVKPLQCLGGLSGSLALATSSISSGACQTVTPGSVNSVAAPVVVATDVIQWAPNGSLSGVTGFAPATSGGLSIAAYPTAGYVNFDVCNWSASPITPSAVTVNWKVPK